MKKGVNGYFKQVNPVSRRSSLFYYVVRLDGLTRKKVFLRKPVLLILIFGSG